MLFRLLIFVLLSLPLAGQQLILGPIPAGCNDGDVVTWSSANSGFRCQPPPGGAGLPTGTEGDAIEVGVFGGANGAGAGVHHDVVLETF